MKTYLDYLLLWFIRFWLFT